MVDKSIDQTRNILTTLKPYVVGDISFTESGIIDALQKIAAVLDAHIGSGVSAHTPVSRYQAGFMTRDLWLKFYEIAGGRTYVGGGRDILELEPGKYYGLKFKNGPLVGTDDEDATVTVDVSEIEGLGKQILVIKSFTGQTYLYTTHTNGAGTNFNAPSVWTSIPRFANLWEGSLTTVGTKFNLKDDISKYTRLIFTINTGNGATNDISLPSVGNIFNVDTIKRHNSTVGLNVYEVGLNITGKTGSVIKNVSDAINEGGGGPVATSDVATIRKIVGVLE
ncbi:hypothetical protein [Pediococcus pentosaceus]|uniref:hypothetical protein n=1 Tax=Pediococcus pentosaceus TaxID=1255 RepID=UPI002380B8B6|nr:hypothetical protein [Pediococcus pentosaceus]MDE3751886.1 hypothetical protein [Pediococcus pentosaceus]